jgi:ectoine hydroxylase-related dioxygenase (phytanoyl-CoA dioxygenase family)
MNTTFSPTIKDKESFDGNGYWISPVIFEDQLIENMKIHYYKVLQGEYETGIEPNRNISPDKIAHGVVKITNCLWTDSTLSKLILSPIIGKIAARLIGANSVRYWRDHLWYKHPKSGADGSVGWHQDYYPYWSCAEPANLITAWIALNNITEENGCVRVVPGSHKWGVFEDSDLYSHNMDELEKKVENSMGHKFEAKACVLKAGSVLFTHCLTLHGSYENVSNEPRLGISVHIFPDGTKYKAGTKSEKFSNVKLFSGKNGEKFEGPFFPIIYRDGHHANPWESI